jgi:hypothetical protein
MKKGTIFENKIKKHFIKFMHPKKGKLWVLGE